MYNNAFYKKVIVSSQINDLLIVVPYIYFKGKKRSLTFKCKTVELSQGFIPA